MSAQVNKTIKKTSISSDVESSPGNTTVQYDGSQSNCTLPVIDILQFCTHAENLQRKKAKEKPSKIPQTISMFKASSFGIDGSFPPRISSWSCRTHLYRVPRATRSRWSRTKSEISLVHHEDTRQFQNPRSGFSSPCFHGANTPVRCRQTSQRHGNYLCKETDNGCGDSGLGGENFIISKVNLNKRPKKKLMNIKTDAQGNITSISETDSRRPIDLRRSIDSAITSLSTSDQSKPSFLGLNGAFPDTYNEGSCDRNIISSDNYRSNDNIAFDEEGFPSITSIKKIDIKLPC